MRRHLLFICRVFVLAFVPASLVACNKADDPKPRQDTAKSATPVPSDMVFNDFLPENLKIRGDGGIPEGGLPSGGPADPTADDGSGKPRVTEPGAEPRTARKYVFTAGKTAKRTFTLKGSASQGGQTQDQPGITILFEVATKKVTNGTGSMELKVTGIELADKDKVDKQTQAGFMQQFAGGIGMAMAFDVDPHGRFGEVSITTQDKMQKPGAAEVVQIAQAVLEVLFPLLPEEPIGVGAKWEAGADTNGVKGTQSYELKDFDKDSGTIESKLEQHAGKRPLNNPRAPRGAMVQSDINATTTYSFRLDSPPTKVRNETTQKETVSLPAQEGQKPQSQVVEIKKQLSVDTAK